ncbi:MFS transporter [Azospirillum sp.]|uniref:MFS transporter n=1 Tax=Azospirillum sp. TaxID=34012 RepID=UPI002D4A0021|nr:MFS transporter [Azospirillum sp.]HYD68605.1 MFS transporter [Azospirillum sp.]
MAGLFFLTAAGIGALAWRAPSLVRAACRTPLRATALAAAPAAALSLGTAAVFAAALGPAAGRDLAWDVAVVLLASLLTVFEGMLLLTAAPEPQAGEPKPNEPKPNEPKPNIGGLAGIRFALFLFMLAEELSRSFLPLYVRGLYTPVPGLSEALVMGMPIALFMLLAAVFTPFAGAWADRFGTRRTLLLGTLPAVAGFAGTAAAQTLGELLLWRGACAFGYAIMFIGAQGFVACHSRRQERARGMAQFVAAVVAAGLCGAPIGGILADHVGPRATFAVSALLTLAAVAAVAALLPAEAPERAGQPAATLRDYRRLLANPRFRALLLFSSVPTKLLLTGGLFYLVPVTLHGLGETPSAIGRTMMAYGLGIVVLGPWVSRLADRTGRHALIAGLGGLAGGAGLMAVLLDPGAAAVLAGVAALGVAHALNNATQLTLVPDVCRAECARIGTTGVFAIYRLLERGGAVLGPLLAAALADRFGPPMALGALGAIGLGCAAAFCLVFVLTPAVPAGATEPAREGAP